MLPSQYYHFCRLASLGTVGKSSGDTSYELDCSTVNVFTIVYKSKGYVAAIESCAKASMMKAIYEIKATLKYETDGEVQLINNSALLLLLICSGSSLMLGMTQQLMPITMSCWKVLVFVVYFTSLCTLIFSMHKIVGCVTISRKEHTCAQMRELACTKEVLPLVLSKGTERFE